MAKLSLEGTVKLKSGYEIPQLGYGVSLTRPGFRSQHTDPP